MVIVSFVIPLFIQLNWYEYVKNVITGVFRDDVSSVGGQVLQMPIIVENVSNRRRIEMDVQKLSTWDPPKQISFMNEKNMALRNDRIGLDRIRSDNQYILGPSQSVDEQESYKNKIRDNISTRLNNNIQRNHFIYVLLRTYIHIHTYSFAE
jgi:hypothetical protein